MRNLKLLTAFILMLTISVFAFGCTVVSEEGSDGESTTISESDDEENKDNEDKDEKEEEIKQTEAEISSSEAPAVTTAATTVAATTTTAEITTTTTAVTTTAATTTTAAVVENTVIPGLSCNAYLAGVYGESQENAVWSFDSPNNYPVPADSTAAVIKGNGTYEVEWVMQPLSYGPRTEFMAIFIEGLNNQDYPSLQIAVDQVIVDGTPIEYTQSSNACDYNYNMGEMTRIYLKDNWAGTGVADIDEYIEINSSIKVIFTVSGIS